MFQVTEKQFEVMEWFLCYTPAARSVNSIKYMSYGRSIPGLVKKGLLTPPTGMRHLTEGTSRAMAGWGTYTSTISSVNEMEVIEKREPRPKNSTGRPRKMRALGKTQTELLLAIMVYRAPSGVQGYDVSKFMNFDRWSDSKPTSGTVNALLQKGLLKSNNQYGQKYEKYSYFTIDFDALDGVNFDEAAEKHFPDKYEVIKARRTTGLASLELGSLVGHIRSYEVEANTLIVLQKEKNQITLTNGHKVFKVPHVCNLQHEVELLTMTGAKRTRYFEYFKTGSHSSSYFKIEDMTLVKENLAELRLLRER